MDRAAAIAKLECVADAVKARGATALFLYGSTARDEAGESSDLDFFIDYDPTSRFNALDLVDIKLFLEDELDASVDLTTRDGLHPRLREKIENSATRIFLCRNKFSNSLGGPMPDIWEQAVETYLAMDRALFLNPQYVIGTPGEWEASADFLALVFLESAAWMVEVTKRPAGGLFNKISEFEEHYAPRISQQLKAAQIVPVGKTEWKIGFWVFSPKNTEAQIKARMAKAEVRYPNFTPLESTLDPGAWNDRFHRKT